MDTDAAARPDDADPDDLPGGEDHESVAGQVSEVQRMDEPEPISDDQSVAGQPDGESGATDEGPTGPNSRAGADRN